jgi:Uncharacterized protein conserved in bacteria
MQIGKKQMLTVVKKVDFGVYLGNEEERVLLPKKQVPEGVEVGDPIEVFLYKDSSDRMIATTNEPKVTLGKVAMLKVIEVGKIGAFLDWGLEKDLLLPFKQQTGEVKEGQTYPVALYVDKSERLCATMKVYHYLATNSPYKKDDRVQGMVYEKSAEFGVFVAVDGQYSALIPRKEVHRELRVGDVLEARVTDIKPDGKISLSVREKAFLQIDEDARIIFERIEKYNGKLPFTDKAEPEVIAKEFGMSKNGFKRAVGRLLKEGKIEIGEKNIVMR